MQQILECLQNGTVETVRIDEEGVAETIRRPPTALMTRAARLIVQLVNERDAVINNNIQLQQHIAYLEDSNNKLKEINATLNDTSRSLNPEHLSGTGPVTPSEGPGDSSSEGKTEA